MTSTNNLNLKILTTVNSIWAVVGGLIGPFFVIHVQKLSGGMDKLGIAFAIMIFIQSITTYVAGRFSDSTGRKPFLIWPAYAEAIILIFYTVITDTYQLYILQAFFGITRGISGTTLTSFLGDITTKEKRGRNIGKFYAIVGISSSIGLSFGGYIVELYGTDPLFYFASVIIGLSTTLFFFIKEEKNG